jgi:hypothetical protein
VGKRFEAPPSCCAIRDTKSRRPEGIALTIEHLAGVVIGNELSDKGLLELELSEPEARRRRPKSARNHTSVLRLDLHPRNVR